MCHYGKKLPSKKRIKTVINYAYTIINSRKLTQDQLAQKAGVHQATIARIESGDNNLTVRTLTRVAAALGKKLTLL